MINNMVELQRYGEAAEPSVNRAILDFVQGKEINSTIAKNIVELLSLRDNLVTLGEKF